MTGLLLQRSPSFKLVLPQVHRLKQRRDFTAVFQQGIRCHTPHLTLRARRNQTSPFSERPTRIGIAVSLKVSKRAVIRNRVKRQLRAGLRQLLPSLLPGWDVVVIARPEAIGCDYHQFLQELEQLLVEAEILHGH